LKSQLVEECNKCFLQGWHSALDQAGVDDASELYNLGPKHQPFRVGSPEEHEEEEAAGGLRDPEADEVLKDPKAAEDLRDPAQIPVVESKKEMMVLIKKII
jgi:hypothetical protein